MTEEENNAPADDNPEGLAADERAAKEIAAEKAAAGAAVENLVGVGDATIDPDVAERAEMEAVLAQSVSGRNLTARDINMARENGLAFDKEHPEWGEQWAAWARQSADNYGFVMARLAEGTLPDGPPDKFANELAGVSRQHTAQRELDDLNARVRPWDSAYTTREHQARLKALYQLTSQGESIVGRSGRFV